ncbi:DMT family transporter [Desulfosporosinus sp. BICA1-9]|uniref:DMT family transporter n=1 Tax=Desulfosporosinus sp. BICA1-9 TaxID=1531958 RepID=UPI00054BBBBD|nr:DMT family transporter [Desulfosporosinus sp. BICA1-9]KJS86535.1 MAG: DMT(drug/metabolite transporter) superfamily permease [Desulfosporosinus sp. BICA1-9]HBW36913.1 EamA family transporter [Desulfosporosinus sp.]
MNDRTIAFPIVQAIAAAILFGVSAPISKLLLGEIAPVPMAALLYLGSGIGLFLWRYLQKADQRYSNEARIVRSDMPWIIGAILAGGIAAPIVLMFSLKNASASTASLLLNFEGVATTIIAGVVFKENIGKRIWSAVLLITIASILLSWNTSGQWGFSLSSLGVLAACVLWGVDNNFTRNVSAKDPLSIVTIKGLSSGAFSLVLALIIGQPFPHLIYVVGAMILGCLSYGFSIVLFIRAMRELGSARTSALFGIAPFLGAILSVFLFREAQGIQFIVSLPVMIFGAVLLLKEGHIHLHRHTEYEHEHRHCHNDLHHAHFRQGDKLPKSGYHSHIHLHKTTEHRHPHTPDIHHRHIH